MDMLLLDKGPSLDTSDIVENKRVICQDELTWIVSMDKLTCVGGWP